MAAADHAQPLVAHPALVRGHRDSHADELADGVRGEAVAADLVPRERGLLQEDHPGAELRKVMRRCGTTGAGADDDDVGVRVGAEAHV